jgi:hypothetical protein
MKLSLQTFPWLSVSCIALAYGLLGWHLSELSIFWLVEAWAVTVVIVFLLIWRGDLLSRWVRLGPTVLVSIFFISFTVVFAIAYSAMFGLALVLLLSIFWGRLELQSWGMNQRSTLAFLSLMSVGGLTMGWFLSHKIELLEALLSRSY